MKASKKSILLLFLHFFIASCASPKTFVLYKKGQTLPIIYISNPALKDCAEDFRLLFKQLTGETLSITSTIPSTSTTVIQFDLKSLEGFKLAQKEQVLSLQGANALDLKKATRFFFSRFTGLNQFSVNKNVPQQELISLPIDTIYYAAQFLSYKEPYFAENFSPEFRLWNNTQTLEETWALWGHNLGKFITIEPSMYAIVEGKPNDEQFNFSSNSLYNALATKIAEKLADNPAVNKFMIMPNDNDLVCQCAACKQLGNTATNASPAVYALINRLAAKFPQAQFFSTAYITTLSPPTQKAKSNVGVMISTMSFPKGIALESSKKAAEITQLIDSWKEITDQIFIWDYAINFDNYFEFYPTLHIAQKNLQFFLKHGVRGVFMHGSDEGSFAAFGSLKCYLYAQLFNNPNVDLKQQAQLFLENQYPSIGKELAGYYNLIEEEAVKSNKIIDIYGGTQQAINKYLNIEELNKIYNYIISHPTPETETLEMAFIFQQLEVMRIKGIAPEGYATFDGMKAVINPQVRTFLDRLALLHKKTGIDVYNEAGAKLTRYIAQWKTRILSNPYQNLFFKRPFNMLSKMDEDYSKPSMLNDGALGFDDYYNNWLLNSIDAPKLEMEAKGLENAKNLKITFLSDKKHKIYAPAQIKVAIDGRTYTTFVKQPVNSDKIEIVETTLPVLIKPGDKKITIELIKQTAFANKSVACDEIIFY